ncbi:hypothetical protein HK405_010018 [Cladochytrium tenue]|nr:hypothetical protein HK405_010018 [Cladochytrium tenue]
MAVLGSWLLVADRTGSLIFVSLGAVFAAAVFGAAAAPRSSVRRSGKSATLTLSMAATASSSPSAVGGSSSSEADGGGSGGGGEFLRDDLDAGGDGAGDDEDALYNFYPSHRAECDPAERDAIVEKGLDYFKYDSFVEMHRQGYIKGAKWLVGASTGALRSAAILASLVTGEDCTTSLKEHFCEMTYHVGDTSAILRPQMEALYRLVVPESHLDRILSHPDLHLAVLAARVRPEFRGGGLIASTLYYGLALPFRADALRHIITRVCFYTGPEPPRFLEDGFGGKDAIEFVRLTRENIYQEPCRYVAGAGDGLFLDGALTDFSLNVWIPDSAGVRALLLSDSAERPLLRPTALETYAPWRSPPPSFFRNVSVVGPAPALAAALPDRRLPHLTDWFRPAYVYSPPARMRNWRACFDLAAAAWPADGAAMLELEAADAFSLGED